MSFYPSIRRNGLLILGLAGTIFVGTACAPAISTQQEVELGAQASQQIAQELPLVRDAGVNQYLNRLGQSIAQRADPRGIQYQFYVVNAPEVNAFAVPGGHVYINRGLIERAENLSEVAGVLAHEIGHVVHRHGIDQWQRAQQAEMGLGLLYGILLGRAPSGVEQAGIQLGGTAVFAGYSRDAEREADAVAIRYLMDSGIHPIGLVTMFEKLLAERQRNPGSVEQWFSTHPTSEERITNTRAAIAALPAGSLAGLNTNNQGFINFRQRVSQLAAAPR